MKGRILIVDDEKKLADVMSLYLRKEGYETDCVYNGEEGEELIKRNAYNLIILDVMMPEKDGWSPLPQRSLIYCFFYVRIQIVFFKESSFLIMCGAMISWGIQEQ